MTIKPTPDWKKMQVIFIYVLLTYMLVLGASHSIAGTLGFSIQYQNNQLTLLNQGTDAAYNLTLWCLDQSLQWQKLEVAQGNPTYVAPQASITAVRNFELPANGIGELNPLLVQMQDQTGSQIIQLAWQKVPLTTTYPLQWQRNGAIVQNESLQNTQRLKRSFAITTAYTPIAQLEHPVATLNAPQPVQIQDWSTHPIAKIDTGVGHGGLWWLHETMDGGVELQVVPDGIERGKEQIPYWLVFLRAYMLKIASAIALLGMGLMLAGSFKHKSGS